MEGERFSRKRQMRQGKETDEAGEREKRQGEADEAEERQMRQGEVKVEKEDHQEMKLR